MDVNQQIKAYIDSLPIAKSSDMQCLHDGILAILRGCKLWFLDGKNAENKVVSNPNIGYGVQMMTYADGKTKEFYRIGLSANTTGISVYIMGIDDKKYLPETYSNRIGKATVTGYCIKFRKLDDINRDVLEEVIRECGLSFKK